MTSQVEWWSVGIGLMGVLFGLAVLIVCLRLGGLLGRLGKTLDEVDRQLAALGAPVATTLTHVGGIADTADSTIARLGVAIAQLEVVAANAGKTASQVGQVVNNVANNLRRPKHSEEI